MINIYDTANQLADDLKQTDQYKALAKSIEALKNDPESLKLYQRMDGLQKKIMAAQQAGQPMPPEFQKEYQEINQEVEGNDYLKDMITKEQALFQVINEIQQTFTKPISELYDTLKPKDK